MHSHKSCQHGALADHGGLQVDDIQSDALFILLVEKDAAFMRLAEDRFYNDYPCIIITAKGQPDVASRYSLLSMLRQVSANVIPMYTTLASAVCLLPCHDFKPIATHQQAES